MVRKQFIKIAVIFLSLFALVSLLKFSNVKEGFYKRKISKAAQWHSVLKKLLNDNTDFEYRYKKIKYNINNNIKGKIKMYIKSITEPEDFKQFITNVGMDILNKNTSRKKISLNDVDKKKSAKQMIYKYAKERYNENETYTITGTLEKIDNTFLDSN